jgi:hypothetical protein
LYFQWNGPFSFNQLVKIVARIQKRIISPTLTPSLPLVYKAKQAMEAYKAVRC